MNTRHLTSVVLDMALASYLSDDPDNQVRKIARAAREKIIGKRKTEHRLLTAIINAKYPAEIAKQTYEELLKLND